MPCGGKRRAETLHFHFDFTSPYGYVASEMIDRLAARHGSPQIVFRGELFWGTDRLDQPEAALKRAR